ncbi:hypothetical protein [Facklamia sp. P12932]|uniref:hypothetical protein n=1 Tax=Facklamia sp. P12932 TaxID=3421947 RepID=UPI003D1747F0
MTLHLLICRLMILSIVGCIVGGPTASLTAANWKSLIDSGLILGVLAGAVGNYVGIAVAYFTKFLVGG